MFTLVKVRHKLVTGGNIKIDVIDDGKNVIGITFTNATYLAKCSTLNHCTYK